MNDHGQTTELQRAQWEASQRRANPSPKDTVMRSPATFLIALAALCALLIVLGIELIKGL